MQQFVFCVYRLNPMARGGQKKRLARKAFPFRLGASQVQTGNPPRSQFIVCLSQQQQEEKRGIEPSLLGLHRHCCEGPHT